MNNIMKITFNSINYPEILLSITEFHEKNDKNDNFFEILLINRVLIL